MPTRESITGKLRVERDALLQRYRSLAADDLSRPCTDSEVDGSPPWSAKDHLAHLAMIERAFQSMVRRTLDGAERPVGLSGSSRDEVIANVHRNNQDNVDSHRDDDLETLLADLVAARDETLGLLAELTDEQLALKIPGAPWADGTIGGVLMTNAYHEHQHWDWVAEGLGETGSP